MFQQPPNSVKRFLPVAFLTVCLFSSCHRMIPEPEVNPYGTFEKYDAYSRSLHGQVETGVLSVGEAEALRQDAFLQYLEALKGKDLEREKRNY